MQRSRSKGAASGSRRVSRISKIGVPLGTRASGRADCSLRPIIVSIGGAEIDRARESADDRAAAHDERAVGNRLQIGGAMGDIEDRKAAVAQAA